MENGSNFNWLTKSTLISSLSLLFALPSTALAWAAELPSFQTSNTSILLDDRPQKSDTSVSELGEIQSHDWAFQALQSLAEKYNCSIANLSLSQLENRPLSRSEFAVGLNTCLNKFLAQLDQTKSVVANDEFRLWQRLQADFAPELAFLEHNIDDLEIRTAQLQENLFSTTTKLEGEVLFQLADSFGDSIEGDRDESETSFGRRFRLNFDTSFNGTDLLRARFKSTDIARFNDKVTGTNMTRLGSDGEDDGEVEIELRYRFLWGEDTLIEFGGGVGVNDAAEVLNPLSSSGRGAVSRFGRRDPITLRGSGSTGVAIQHKLSDSLQANIGYSTSADNAASPQEGLFNDSYNAVAQIIVEPSDRLEVAFAYTHKYQSEDHVNLMASTGSENANNPFGENATIADNFGLQFNWYATEGFEFGGWFGYGQAQQKQNGSKEATIVDGAFNLTFPDLGHEGNVGGIIIGVPPIVTNHDDRALEDEKTAWHLEALYRIKVTNNIEVTPGFFLVTNPNHEDNDTIWVGTIRSRFSF